MKDALSAAQDAIDKVLLGKSHSIKLALACILAKACRQRYRRSWPSPGTSEATFSPARPRA